jgi:Spy/CpxP family protein refolding chaperone
MYKQFFSVVIAIVLAIGFYGCDKQETSEVLSPESEAVSLENEALGWLPDAGFGFGRMHWIGAEILNLTPAQQEQAKSIIEEHRKSFRASHSNREEKPSREEMKALRKEWREVILNAIMPVLTPEQQAIVKGIQADFDRGEVPAIIVEKRVENFTKKLNLTADQQAQVMALFGESGRKMLALRKSDPEDQALRESIKKLRLEADQQLQSILNPEQQSAYEQGSGSTIAVNFKPGTAISV